MSTGKIIVYVSSVTGNKEMKKQQQRISMILGGKKIDFEEQDIASNEQFKTDMRRKSGNEHQLAPVICNGDEYCGDFDAFDEAVEEEKLMAFLKLET